MTWPRGLAWGRRGSRWWALLPWCAGLDFDRFQFSNCSICSMHCQHCVNSTTHKTGRGHESIANDQNDDEILENTGIRECGSPAALILRHHEAFSLQPSQRWASTPRATAFGIELVQTWGSPQKRSQEISRTQELQETAEGMRSK